MTAHGAALVAAARASYRASMLILFVCFPLAAAAVSYFAKVRYTRALVLEGATLLALIPAACSFALLWALLVGGALVADLLGGLLRARPDFTSGAASTEALFLVVLPLATLFVVRAIVTWLAYPRVFGDLPRKRGYSISFAAAAIYPLAPLVILAAALR